MHFPGPPVYVESFCLRHHVPLMNTKRRSDPFFEFRTQIFFTGHCVGSYANLFENAENIVFFVYFPV